MGNKKIKKCQKKIAKYTKKLQKYRDLLAELTADKEPVTVVAMEKAKVALPDKPVEAPAAEPALVEAPAAEQPKPTRSRRATSSKKPAPEATVVEQSKPTGKRRTPVPESAPVEATPEEQPKPTRRRRATSTKKSAAEGTPVEQPARKRRTPAKKPERASFILYNCDEEKSPESKYNRNDETFKDSQLGRRGLWNKLKTEIAEGRIELLDGYPIRNVRLDIQSGDPVSVSQRLKFGVIEKV